MDGNDIRVFDCPVCVILALAFNETNLHTGTTGGRTLGEGVEVFVREDGGRGKDVYAARKGSVQHVALDLGRLWCCYCSL